jgi:hypothetical protein
MVNPLVWLVAGLLAIPVPAQATAFLGPLAGLVLLGEETPWRGAVEDGAYVLENRDDADAVEYVYVKTPGAGARSLRARVRLEDAGEGAGVGLLYAYRPDPRGYLAVALQGDGVVRVLRHGPDGLVPLLEAGEPPGGEAGVDLALIERTGGVEVLIDGTHATLVEVEEGAEGAVGIVAFGTGRFAFESFELTAEEPAEEAVPAPVAGLLEQLRGAPPQPGAGWQPSPAPQMGLFGHEMQPGQPQPGYPMPGYPMPGYPMPGYPMPPTGPQPGVQPGLPGQVPGYPMQPPLGQPPPGQPPVAQPPVAQPPPLEVPTLREDGTGRGGYEAIVAFARQLADRIGQGGGGSATGTPEGWARHVDRQSGGRLSVDHPRGWQVSSVARMDGPGMLSYGKVRVGSPSGHHFFEGGMQTAQRLVDVYSHADSVVQELAGWLPIQARVDEQSWYPPLPPQLVQAGMSAQTEWLARAYTAGDYLAVIVVGGLQMQGFGGFGMTMLSHRLFVGPMASFTGDTNAVFLPMLASTAHW